MKETATQLVKLLIKKGAHIATAESCTGGMVSAAITSAPGASSVFDGGVVSYANKVKHGILGVSEDILSGVGAVSEECAMAMAQGVRELMGADIGVSLTGIAGPGGGTPQKPVGTVYMGVSTRKETHVTRLALEGDRDNVRRLSVLAALDAAIEAANNL